MRRVPLVLLLLSACVSPPLPPPGPAVSSVAVMQRDWHTDICLRDADADDWVRAMAGRHADARFLCFGFGERRYAAEHDHALLTQASALLGSEGTILTTALRAPPEQAFGADNVVWLPVSEAGLAGLRGWLRRSTTVPGADAPVQLAAGPYPGARYLATPDRYFAFNTCNTWTEDAMRAAGLDVSTGGLFAGDVMRQAHRLAGRE